ncbi:MAG TPA: CoA-binding protein [Alphaproteobacteria bacterium]
MTASISDILKNSKTIAIVGASSNPERPSHSIMGVLMRAGYKCFPINPNEEEVLGEPAYASLDAIPTDVPIDIVNVFRRPGQTPDVAKAAAARGAKTLWLQQGIANDEARSIAEAAGLNYVEDSCIAVELRKLG